MANRSRTLDVASSARSFADLMLSDNVVRALAGAGFIKPSPVQQAALPLARLGVDMITQAKSGTGKTVVFATCCLERVKADQQQPQVCPTPATAATLTAFADNRQAAPVVYDCAVACAGCWNLPKTYMPGINQTRRF